MPTLENWKWTAGNTVTGNVYGKPGTPDGTQMMTGAVPPEGRLGTHVVRVLPQSALAAATAAAAAGCYGGLLRVWPPARLAACARAADARGRFVQVTESGSSYLLGKPDPAEAVAAVSGYHSRFGGYLGYMLYALLTLCVFIVFLLDVMKVRPVYFGFCSGSQICSLARNSVDCNALNIASSFFSSASSCKWISWTPFTLFCLVALGFFLHKTAPFLAMRGA